eukprot:CAMPEP_0194368238 /NCGR_PEP_ID=MMETSP0174-20130528/16479_1 /TAXON_ID=216777 /ORGANISM="Proboscia alata, Strain PI-D3" /LENGTH=332 /DNA_ID=CAMNT_0039144509 /DNA_START=156 /DNA_END=1154 /DNA_ORIENTATION=+
MKEKQPFSRLVRMFGSNELSNKSATVNKIETKNNEQVNNMLYRIRKCNTVPEEVKNTLITFEVDGTPLGKLLPDFAQRLSLTPIFDLDSSNRKLSLTPEAGTSCEERTEAVHEIMKQLNEEGLIKAWRGEMLPLTSRFDIEPLLLIERAAAAYFGAIQYGVHINGYVRTDDGETMIWMARRSKDKSKYPGMLDHIVAGGMPFGISPTDNVVKECEEEAGIPRNLVLEKLRSVGGISYEYLDELGCMSRSVIFCYDLELPVDFVPKPVDGEVDEFFLWDYEQLCDSMSPDYHDPIKPNCYLVKIDYLLRMGYITPESPQYLDVLRELRSGDCY